jgi:hypothetical protein
MDFPCLGLFNLNVLIYFRKSKCKQEVGDLRQ